MSRIRLLLTAAAVAAACFGLSVPAAAADIAVQLDGNILSFGEFAPISRSVDGGDRTFLPLRQTFEALSCELDWDQDSQTATATRGDTTVTMTLGSPNVSIDRGGNASTLVMDTAAFALYDSHGGGYTYVPVRFAAEAFGCTVGWDQANQTVLIYDNAALLSAATAGRTYTMAEACDAYLARLDRPLTLSAEVQYTRDGVTMDGTASGVICGGDAELELRLPGDSGAERSLLLRSGPERLWLSGSLLSAVSGVSDAAWYAADPVHTQAPGGYAPAGLLAYCGELAPPTKRDGDFDAYCALVDAVAALISDQAFETRSGSAETSGALTLLDGETLTISLTVSRRSGQITGCTAETALGGQSHSTALVGNRLQARLEGPGAALTLNGTIAEAGRAPVTAPPDGSDLQYLP